MIDDALHVRLEDWAWWVRDRKAGRLRCRSVEGRYRPERVEDDERRAPRRVVDAQDAALIERAISHPDMPRQAHDLLVGWYVLRVSQGQICRRLGVPKSMWDERMGWAARILRNRIDKSVAMPTITGNNLNPADMVSIPCQMAGIPMSETEARIAA